MIGHIVNDEWQAQFKVFPVESWRADTDLYISPNVWEGAGVYIVADEWRADMKVNLVSTPPYLSGLGGTVSRVPKPPPKWHCPRPLGRALVVAAMLLWLVVIFGSIMAVIALAGFAGYDPSGDTVHASKLILLGYGLCILALAGITYALNVSDYEPR